MSAVLQLLTIATTEIDNVVSYVMQQSPSMAKMSYICNYCRAAITHWGRDMGKSKGEVRDEREVEEDYQKDTQAREQCLDV